VSEELSFRDGVAHLEDVSLLHVAQRCGTPTYVYSRAHLASQYAKLDAALQQLPHRICYAVKANGNLAILNLFASLGAGFDIVSGGELERVLRAGGDPASVIFSGVGKSGAEIDFALKVGIGSFNVESAAELDRLELHAQRLSRKARVSVRVNPDIDAGTHPYISTGLKSNKFGVPRDEALAMYRRASNSQWLEVLGVDCHIGSQIAKPGPLVEALQSLLALVDTLEREGIRIEHLDLGGGFGVTYRDEPEFDVAGYASELTRLLHGRSLTVSVEPGRYLVANGGVLLTRVEYLKPARERDARNFAVVDAAMNDLIRPTLYQAWHGISVVESAARDGVRANWDIVGPVCESADFLAHDRDLTLAEGSLLAIRSAGAYGFVQSSNYNARNRAAEVLVDGASFSVVRRRETIADQLRAEVASSATEEAPVSGAPLQYRV
jgi:diaminopimelate decarboxylase